MLIIDMQDRSAQCCVCGEWDRANWGIPISAITGSIVSNNYPLEWFGMPACRECHEKHESGAFLGEYPQF